MAAHQTTCGKDLKFDTQIDNLNPLAPPTAQTCTYVYANNFWTVKLEAKLFVSSKGAFTPDANKSCYSRVVGRLNILSLLASFAREIHYTTDANSRHGSRGLHGLKTEARTRPVPEIVWPNPTRPERHS